MPGLCCMIMLSMKSASAGGWVAAADANAKHNARDLVVFSDSLRLQSCWEERHFFAGALIFTVSAVLPSAVIFTTTRCPTASSDCFATWSSECSHFVFAEVWI